MLPISEAHSFVIWKCFQILEITRTDVQRQNIGKFIEKAFFISWFMGPPMLKFPISASEHLPQWPL
jgi:hypothetical protein